VSIWRLLADCFRNLLSSRYYFILIFVISYPLECFSQEYTTLNISGKIELPATLSEISGMDISDRGVFALNDSGNEPIIYLLDSSDFSIVSEYTLESIKNHDWEELSIYGDSVFIGDFGNNFGNRRDLAIHSISLSDLMENKQNVTSRFFSYSGQTSFTNLPYLHRWDCETMIITEGKIYLVSKDWPNRRSLFYKIDRDSTYSDIAPFDEIDIGYLITGSFFNEVNSRLYLCGYLENSTYFSIATVNSEMNISGEIKTYIVPELNNHQVESIYVFKNMVYLGSEATSNKQSIYLLRLPLLDE
jgi:hypothetical protein